MTGQLSKKILFAYCAGASIFITANGLLTAGSIESVVFTALFLPVTLYFVVGTINRFKQYFIYPKPQPSPNEQSINKTEVTIALILLLSLTAVGIVSISSNTKATTLKPQQVDPVSLIEQEKIEPLKFSGKEVVVQSVVVTIEDGSPFVNIRSKPTVYSEVVGEAKNDAEYELIEEASGWYKIKSDGVEGYISIKYAEIIEE